MEAPRTQVIMLTANSLASKVVVTAALLVIGGKIGPAVLRTRTSAYIPECDRHRSQGSAGGRRGRESDRRRTTSLHYVFTTRGIGRSMYRSTPIRARSPSCTN